MTLRDAPNLGRWDFTITMSGLDAEQAEEILMELMRFAVETWPGYGPAASVTLSDDQEDAQ